MISGDNLKVKSAAISYISDDGLDNNFPLVKLSSTYTITESRRQEVQNYK